jgi:putative endonuclease
MGEYVVYVLFSEKYGKKYTGFTTQLIQRFYSHNSLSKKGWTIRFRPWQVVFVRFFKSKKAAMDFEKHLKTGVGRKWIKNTIDFK